MTENISETAADAASAAASASLRASRAIVRASDPKAAVFTAGGIMAEPTSSAVAGGLLAKLLPAGAGAAIMICVDPPQCKRELFARVFVAMVCAYLFGDTVLDMLHSFSLFAFLDAAKRAHQVAIDGLTGGLGWSLMGGVSMWLRKFRANPTGAIAEAKKDLA